MFEHQGGQGPAVDEDKRRECFIDILFVGLPGRRRRSWSIVSVKELSSVEWAVKARHLRIISNERRLWFLSSLVL